MKTTMLGNNSTRGNKKEILNKMTTEIKMDIDSTILQSLKQNKAEFTKELLFYYSLHLYRQGKLSLGKAAQLAGYTRIDYIWKLKDKGEAIFDYSSEEISEMIEKGRWYSEKVYNEFLRQVGEI